MEVFAAFLETENFGFACSKLVSIHLTEKAAQEAAADAVREALDEGHSRALYWIESSFIDSSEVEEEYIVVSIPFWVEGNIGMREEKKERLVEHIKENFNYDVIYEELEEMQVKCFGYEEEE